MKSGASKKAQLRSQSHSWIVALSPCHKTHCDVLGLAIIKKQGDIKWIIFLAQHPMRLLKAKHFCCQDRNC